MTINEGWEKEHPLLFKHKKFGTLLRTEHGHWEQDHPDDGIRTLKSETLRQAILEAEKPFKKQKVKAAKQSKSKKKKSLAVAATILKPKKPSIKKYSKKKVKLIEEVEVKNIPKKSVKKKMPIKKEKEPVNKKPATKKVNKKGKKK